MKRMTYMEFSSKREELDLRLIDVREADEFALVHVKGAELFPLSRIRFGEIPVKDARTVALICRSGARSAMAASILESQGFTETINIEGGTLAAIAEGPEHVEKQGPR